MRTIICRPCVPKPGRSGGCFFPWSFGPIMSPCFTIATPVDRGLIAAVAEDGGLVTAVAEDGGLVTAVAEDRDLFVAVAEDRGLVTAEAGDRGLVVAVPENVGLALLTAISLRGLLRLEGSCEALAGGVCCWSRASVGVATCCWSLELAC